MEFWEILNIAILYTLAYGFGRLLSKCWGWFRFLILLIIVGSFIANTNFKYVTPEFTLVFIGPLCLLVISSFIHRSSPTPRLQNPFVYLLGKIIEIKYSRHSKYSKYRDREREWQRMEQEERIFKMQQEEYRRQREEAERQRQFEKERFERERAERESRYRQQESKKYEEQKQNKEQKQTQFKDPYEVLGVDESMSFDEIHKIFKKLSLIYHPDTHNTKNDTKFKEINEAYEIIRKKMRNS